MFASLHNTDVFQITEYIHLLSNWAMELCTRCFYIFLSASMYRTVLYGVILWAAIRVFPIHCKSAKPYEIYRNKISILRFFSRNYDFFRIVLECDCWIILYWTDPSIFAVFSYLLPLGGYFGIQSATICFLFIFMANYTSYSILFVRIYVSNFPAQSVACFTRPIYIFYFGKLSFIWYWYAIK